MAGQPFLTVFLFHRQQEALMPSKKTRPLETGVAQPPFDKKEGLPRSTAVILPPAEHVFCQGGYHFFLSKRPANPILARREPE
jgi:hypothetical protein